MHACMYAAAEVKGAANSAWHGHRSASTEEEDGGGPGGEVDACPSAGQACAVGTTTATTAKGRLMGPGWWKRPMTERERERVHIHTCMYIYIYIYVYSWGFGFRV